MSCAVGAETQAEELLGAFAPRVELVTSYTLPLNGASAEEPARKQYGLAVPVIDLLVLMRAVEASFERLRIEQVYGFK